ncbi:hypothetical protein [Ensifer aridi]|uniref:hypothetical protein n=1 Tax=Ensifer aridi TaxID=1708715 RepID=UPI000407069E|nr:hypothetical protein [Ensifer aridi]
MMDAVAAHRKLDSAFLDALEELAKSPHAGNWWRDVLASDDLFVAVRRNSLNVYYRGASIFKIDWNGTRIVPSTHAKYLVRQDQTYVPLIEGQFQHSPASLIWDHYEGPETLRQMMRAATPFAGEEKSGLHPLIMGDPSVIDAEIALTRAAEEQADTEKPATAKQDRLDAAVARNTADGPSIVFYEAKHFSNSALRASGDNAPAVIGQMDDYEKALTYYAPSLTAGYVEVARALVRIDELRKSARNSDTTKLDPLIAQIAKSGIPPIIDTKPRLLIFGFDKAQRDDPAWRKHLEKLEIRLDGRVRAIGNPTRQTVAFR